MGREITKDWAGVIDLVYSGGQVSTDRLAHRAYGECRRRFFDDLTVTAASGLENLWSECRQRAVDTATAIGERSDQGGVLVVTGPRGSGKDGLLAELGHLCEQYADEYPVSSTVCLAGVYWITLTVVSEMS